MSRGRWIALLFITAVILVIAPSLGAQWLSPTLLFDRSDSSTAQALYLKLRLPRVLLGFLAGAALSMSGVVFQALFRNALASPFTLGVSGGAAVGASLSFFLPVPMVLLGISTSAVFALCGAVLTVGLVWVLAMRRNTTTLTILLSGVVISFICSSIIMLLQYLGDFGEVFRMTHWMLGTLEVVGFKEVLTTLPFVLLGALALMFDLSALNIMTLGEEFAQSRGVSVRTVQVRSLLAVSLIIGGIVSVCGPIGFVGIIVPFLCRTVVGYDHRVLVPVSLLGGGSFLVACDALSRLLVAPVELPVGVCTALIGGPVFLWMLLRRDQFLVESRL